MGSISSASRGPGRPPRSTLLLRVSGLPLLAGTAALAARAHWLMLADATDRPTPPEFALCVGAVVLLMSGLALVMAGAGLFHSQPRPPRPLFP